MQTDLSKPQIEFALSASVLWAGHSVSAVDIFLLPAIVGNWRAEAFPGLAAVFHSLGFAFHRFAALKRQHQIFNNLRDAAHSHSSKPSSKPQVYGSHHRPEGFGDVQTAFGGQRIVFGG